MADSEKEPGSFAGEFQLLCTCGQLVQVGETDNGLPAVAHHEPVCVHFEELNALEFVTYLRRHYEQQTRLQATHRRKPSN